MDIPKITQQLKDQYPNKNIVITNPHKPTEIICDIKPTSEHIEFSEAIAVVDEIRPHYHKMLTETYEILQGELTLHLEDETQQTVVRVLKTGEKATIDPNVIHWGFGNETWIRVSSKPGWTPQDHILTHGEDEMSRLELDSD